MQEIVHLHNGQAPLYAGNYSSFERQRAETLTRQAAVYQRQQQRVAEIRRFVDRFRAKRARPNKCRAA